MFKHLCFIILAGTISAQSVSAGVILSIENAPTDYTPGTPFAFDVRLQGATNLNFFNIQLKLTASAGAPGEFFFLNAQQAPSEYVFGAVTTGGFSFFGTGDVINFNDEVVAPPPLEVDTAPNTNEFVARVFVNTAEDVGDLTIAFDETFVALEQADFNPIPDFDPLDPLTFITPAPLPFAPPSQMVPEPASIAIWSVIGLAGLPLARRARKRKAARG